MWYYEELNPMGRWSPRTEPSQPSATTTSGTKRKIRAVRAIPMHMWDHGLHELQKWSDDLLAAETAAAEPVPETLPPERLVGQPTAFIRIHDIALEVAHEVERAERKHAPMHSPHEGWSVIYEELEELREHVRGDTGRSAAARKEALQIAAMGIRYALNLCSEE